MRLEFAAPQLGSLIDGIEGITFGALIGGDVATVFATPASSD
jgi:hypothetical protein